MYKKIAVNFLCDKVAFLHNALAHVEKSCLVLVLEENLSARLMCLGGHIFLGNSVLLDKIYLLSILG